MKKSKILNIMLTSVMLLSTILTPQMSYALASMQDDGAEEITEVEQTDTSAEEEENVGEEPADDEDDNSDEGNGSAELTDLDGETESNEPEDEPQPVEEDEVVSEEPEVEKANSPPVEDIDEGSDEISATTFDIGLMVEDLGNIFTFESLTINDDEIDDGNIIVIEEGTIANIRFKWDTEERNVQAGDTASIQLSDAFEIVTTPNAPIMVEGLEVGTYHVENGVLVFEFSKNIETSDVHNGYVDLGLEFNLDKFRENIEQEIPFNDSNDQNITVVARPNLEHSGIDKEGRPDTSNDAREITWTIDVINTNDEEITGATLADDIPDGLGVARDFEIHELSVNYDGDIREGADVTSTLNPSEFPLDLGTVAPFNGYRVQYTTTIENYAAESFTNDAMFEYGETSIPADATVGGLTRSNPIEKDGWQVGKSDVIQWQIDVNKNGSLINEAIVYDNLPVGLTINPENIKVVRITQDGNNWIEGEAHEKSFTEFPINLEALGQEDAYRIKFETAVDWSAVNDSQYQENNGFENKTTLYDGEDELNDDDATVNIVRDPILRKVGQSNVNYNNKTVTWTIHVNEPGHPIGNVILTDLIPEGLTVGKIDITDQEGNDYTPNSIDLNDHPEGGTEVVINLGNVGTQQLKVVYTTAITDFTINNFINGVGMTGDGIGPDGENANANIRPAGNLYGKSFKGINYNAKTIDWQLNVNPRREAIDSLIIEDTFPNRGMILLPDEVKVNFKGEELERGTDYTLAPRTEDGETGYHKGFIITILDRALPLDGGQLVVDYKTSYDPQLVIDGNTLDPHEPIVGVDNNTDRLYVNSVHYTGKTVNNNDINQERNASERVREDSWNSGKKEGQLVHFTDDQDVLVNGWESGSERKIAWQLYFNYQEQNLGTGVVVTDELAYAGNIDKESIRVSIYDVAPDGKTTITKTVLDPENYSLDTDEVGKFILTFRDGFEVTERYVIEFTTSVPDISTESYTNNATVTAGGVDYDYSATLDYKEYDDFLNKSAVNIEGDRVFTGDEVDWEATVNESLSIITGAVITDTISAGHTYLEGTLEIYKSQDRENALEPVTDYTLDVQPVTDEDGELTGATNLVINITDDLHDTLVLEYTTVVTETDGEIGNSISLEGTVFDQQVIESGGLNARQFSSVGGEWAPSRGAIQLTKIDAEEKVTIENNEATFTLWYDLNNKRVQFGEQEYTTEDGILEIGNLPFRTYYLREGTPPTGYVKSEEDLEIVVDTAVGNDQDNRHFAEGIFENIKEKIDVTGTKAWDNGPKPSIELQLFRDNEAVDDPVTLNGTEDEPWTYTWAGLDKTDIDGKEYIYTVDEVNVPENYNKTISDDGLTITNEFESPLIDIPVEKRWEDSNDQDDVRPDSIEVELLAGGTATDYDNLVLSSASDWKGIFTDLPELDIDGNRIEYSVDEVDFDGGYESEITGNVEDGFVVINSREPEQIEISGEKIWKDDNDRDRVRPNSITVNLLADGTQMNSINVTEDDNWAYKFESLDKFKDGNEIVYTITENTVKGYTQDVEDVNYNDYNITNNYTPKETGVTVTKAWVDESNQDDLRPESIRVQLTANGDNVGEIQELSAEDNWTYTWIGLPLNDNGIAINYSVEEVSDPGKYTAEINDDDHGNIIITNKYTPEVTEVSITKEWNDEDNLAGFRPSHIEAELYADGAATGKIINIVADEEGVWEGSFINLPKYRDEGEQIEYSIQEVNIDKDLYSLEMNSGEEDENGFVYDFTLINTHEVERMNLEGTKTWNDAENQDGVRPESITVRLLANGEEVADVEVTEATDWTFEFASLPKFADGEVINYTIQEDKVEGYETIITGTSEDGFVITNTHRPEDPEEPGKPGEEKPGGNDIEDPADSDKGSNLPKSGEAASYTLLALVLVGLGLGLRFYGKRRTN